MNADRIIADVSLWHAALDGRLGSRQAIFTRLRQQKRLIAPAAVFGRLLGLVEREGQAETVRVWAVETPTLVEGVGAWLAAGDLGGHLRGHGVELDPFGQLVAAVAVREALPVWSLDPAWQAVVKHLPIRRFDPGEPDGSPFVHGR